MKALNNLYIQNQNKISIHRIKKILREIWESVSGTDQDFTSGSLSKAILLLSVPMVLEMIMESIFAVVDIFFVSKLGADAIATVGITESLITIIYALGIGLSSATTALVARRIGEKENRKAANTAFQAIITGTTISIIIAIAGIIFARDLLRLMGASEVIVNDMWQYTAIMLGSNVLIMLLFIINAIFRSAGDAAISMRVLFLANGVNIVLDPCLIFGWGPFPELGVVGAATATSIGRGLAVIYQFYLLFRGKGRVKLILKDCLPDFKIIVDILKLSIGSTLQMLIATTSWIFLVRIIAKYGSDVVAGYTIGIRVIIFALLPSFGISNAAATLVGQNLGAKKPDRAERSVWFTSRVNFIFLGMLGATMIMFAEPIIMIFDDSEAIVRSGVLCLRIISYGFLFYGVGMVLIQSFNGAGDTVTPAYINLVCFWMIEIPLAYFLATRIGWKEEGVYYAIIIAETLMTITAAILFKRGKWKLKEV
jgi:putative MATE family efflux protein